MAVPVQQMLLQLFEQPIEAGAQLEAEPTVAGLPVTGRLSVSPTPALISNASRCTRTPE
jgi:hypothetical protein